MDKPPDSGIPAGGSDEHIADLQRQLDSTKAELERLQKRRSVRAALKIASVAKPLMRRMRRSEPGASQHRQLTADDVAGAIRSLRPDAGPSEGPLVSIVIPTRDGFAPLSALLPALDTATIYRSFEVIIVDNASADDSASLFKAAWTFPLHVIRNEQNASFSEACNQGAEAANGEFVLLLNNDVLPINAGWLGAMVATAGSDDAIAAVGALLVYPQSTQPRSLTVQHRGVAIDVRNGELRPMNLGGGDPTDPELAATWAVPAATAACLLIRTEVYRKVGGLDESYVYGTEDVDLCLTLREAGHEIAVNGNAVLFHQEFATQRTVPQADREAGWLRNLAYFSGKWGARVGRAIKLSKLDPTGIQWSPEQSDTIGITLTDKRRSAGWGDWYTAHELGDAFEAIGWSVIYLETGKDENRESLRRVDVLVCLLDGFDPRAAAGTTVKVAWIRNWTDRWLERPWIGDFDAILPSSAISASLIVDQIDAVPRVLPLATNPDRFRPVDPDPAAASDIVLTANLWGEDRSSFGMLDLNQSEDFAIYGKGWDREPSAQTHWRGVADYDLLPAIYSSAKIVLDDTASPTLPFGALNSRVFDALACGTLVVTDNQVGSAEVFDGQLPSFGTGEELRDLLDRYLGDSTERNALAQHLRDVVLARHTYEHRATEIISAAQKAINAPRVSIKIGVPSEAEAETWGDTHFAAAFAKSLRRLGFRTSVDLLPDWETMANQDVDAVIHIRGLSRYTPKSGHVNVLWMISHPDDINDAECELYDLVLVASETYAQELRQRLQVPVHALLQATDPEVFFPDLEVSPSSRHGFVFVGNSRLQQRPGVQAAVESGLELEVYGGDWDGLIPAEVVRGEFVPNCDVGGVYSRAKFVLSDHWPDMAAHGFISNRIFDAGASGALIVSDPVAGMDDLFGSLVPTFSGSDELQALASDIAARAQHYESVRQRLRALVLKSHTFDHRAATFAALVDPLLAVRTRSVASGSAVV